MIEIYKDVVGYEKYYQISNMGNLKGHDGIKLVPSNTLNGYKKCVLCVNQTKKNFSIHRLVAKAFIPNPENKPQVNHIDSNKKNNYESNLEWCTQSENTLHAYNNGILITKSVFQYDRYMNKISEYSSIRKASKHIGVDPSSLSRAVNGITRTSGGFVWRFSN